MSSLAIGKNVVKVDAVEKATTGAGYIVNLRLPGMLHAKIVRSPIAHGRIKGIDVSRAVRLPGAKAAITYLEVPRIPFNPTGEFLPLETGEHLFVKDTYIFDNRVRFVGDPVAAVAAETEEAAEEACDLIHLDFEELPSIFDPVQAMAEGAPLIHDAERNIAGHLIMKEGDIERGFRESDHVFEDVYKTPRVQAVPLEPHVCVCRPDPDGSLTVWSSTQSIFVLRSRLAEALGITKEKIRVERPAYIGGGFGTKVEMHAEGICAILALKTGKPVKLEYSREEDFISTSRHPVTFKLKTGVKRDGTFVARQAFAIADAGAYARHTHVNQIMGSTFVGSYKSPHFFYEAYCVYTNNPPSGSLRGFGGPQPNYAVESQIDQIAEELRMDPMELRLRNAYKVNEQNPWTRKGLTISSYGLEECIRKGADRISWGTRNNPDSQTAKGTRLRRGIGMACLPTWVSGTVGITYIPEFSGAILSVNGEGSVELTTAVVDIGGGQSTVLAQIAAEELGISIDHVIVKPSDTDDAPGDTATHATRVSFVVGAAVKATARILRELLIAEAAKLLNEETDRLALNNGSVIVVGEPTRSLSFGEIAKKAGKEIKSEVHRHSPPNNAVPCAAHFAEVEVDMETGKVNVLKYVAAHDVGKALFPAGVEGQIEGGVQLGIEFALTAELCIDHETGRALNTDLLDYKVITAKDMPPVESIIVETHDPSGPYGAKGIGEPPLIPVAATLANAIYNATSIRVKELPMAPERMLHAIKTSNLR